MNNSAILGKTPLSSDNSVQKHSQWLDVWKRLRRNKLSMVGLVIVILLILLAVFADLVSPYDYAAQNMSEKLQMPSASQ